MCTLILNNIKINIYCLHGYGSKIIFCLTKQLKLDEYYLFEYATLNVQLHISNNISLLLVPCSAITLNSISLVVVSLSVFINHSILMSF